MKKKTWLQHQKEVGAHCRYCGTNKDLSVDHIIPKSRNGLNSKKNYQVLCKFCNHKKSNLTDKEVALVFKEIKQRGVWYEWEAKYQSWLDYIEIKRREYRKPDLNWQ